MNTQTKLNFKFLDQSYQKDATTIAAECFKNDNFFDWLGDEQQKFECLYKLYSECFKICMEIGACLGIFLEEKLIGNIFLLDYDKLKENKKYFEIIFDEHSNFGDDVREFMSYANNLKNGYYILAICVKPEYQKCGYGTQAIAKITELFSDKNLFADVDNAKSLSMYRKVSYDITKISDKFYYVLKPSYNKERQEDTKKNNFEK